MMNTVLSGLIRVYQLVFRPWLGSRCRFYPSCSDYALQALREHGSLRGMGLAVWRIARCHPWNAGGFDPVPEVAAPAATKHDCSCHRHH